MIPRPRRLAPPAPIGTLLKQMSAPPQQLRKTESGLDPDYLALIRQCPCLSCGMDPCGEAAHLRMASAAYGKVSGLGKKPADRWALSLCPDCHRLARHAQHNQSEAQFWNGLGINPLIVCERLYYQRGDLIAMRAVVFVAIAERGRPT